MNTSHARHVIATRLRSLILTLVLSCSSVPTGGLAQAAGYSPPELNGLFWGADVPRTPGRHWLQTRITNEFRPTIVYIPTNRSVVPTPLVLALHGGAHRAATMEGDHPNLIAAASEQGVVLAFPNGHNHPEGGRNWDWFSRNATNKMDRGHLEGVILWLQHYLPIDPKRTFMTGFSAGGWMTQRFATGRPNRIQAGVSFCSSTGLVLTNGVRLQMPTPTEAMSMFLVRGGQDRKVPPDGAISLDGRFADTVLQQLEFWVAAAGGTPDEVVTRQIDNDTTRYTYEGGTTLVEMTYSKSLGHQWPTRYDRPMLAWLLSLPADPTLHLDGTNVVVTYPSGVLQSTDVATGPWTDVEGATSPYSTRADGAVGFFRTRR